MHINEFVKIMCFIGGANLDILQKCPTEKNGFIAIGIGILNVVLVSIIAIKMVLYSVLNNFILSLVISLFYGFVIFIGYWGILSVIRKTVKYTAGIKIFSFIAIVLISFISSYSIEKYVVKNDVIFQSISIKADIFERADFFENTEDKYTDDSMKNALDEIIVMPSWQNYINAVIVFLILMIIYLMPSILKLLINSSPYEEEKERVEYNFISQKEADMKAYKEKYQDYAALFNDAHIKMNSIKQLGILTQEYHSLMEKVQKETFDFINKIEKANVNGNVLLDECKINTEEQFKKTISKMSEIFESVYR